MPVNTHLEYLRENRDKPGFDGLDYLQKAKPTHEQLTALAEAIRTSKDDVETERNIVRRYLELRITTTGQTTEDLKALRQILDSLTPALGETTLDGAKRVGELVVGNVNTVFDPKKTTGERVAAGGILAAIGAGGLLVLNWFKPREDEGWGKYLLRILGLHAVGAGVLYMLGRQRQSAETNAIDSVRVSRNTQALIDQFHTSVERKIAWSDPRLSNHIDLLQLSENNFVFAIGEETNQTTFQFIRSEKETRLRVGEKTYQLFIPNPLDTKKTILIGTGVESIVRRENGETEANHIRFASSSEIERLIRAIAEAQKTGQTKITITANLASNAGDTEKKDKTTEHTLILQEVS